MSPACGGQTPFAFLQSANYIKYKKTLVYAVLKTTDFTVFSAFQSFSGLWRGVARLRRADTFRFLQSANYIKYKKTLVYAVLKIQTVQKLAKSVKKWYNIDIKANGGTKEWNTKKQ